MKNKEPELTPENDLLKPKGNPWIWLILLLIPIVVLMVAAVKKNVRSKKVSTPVEERLDSVQPEVRQNQSQDQGTVNRRLRRRIR